MTAHWNDGMFSRNDFLSAVLPPTGPYCAVGLHSNKTPKQVFVETIEELSDQADVLVHDGYDAYFATASYTDAKDGRKAPNAKELGSLYLDIDCGLGKKYEDQTEGLNALKAFVQQAGLPKPTSIINSGRGLHVYWVFDKALSTAEWKPRAEGLKALCNTHGLHADPAVTADVARILRIPDTLNFKNPDTPQPVKILMWGKRIALIDIEDKLVTVEAVLDIPGEKPFVRQMDATTMALMGNYQSKFKEILLKSLNGEGCAQIAYAYENQETLAEPLWRGVLSIASRCIDGEKAIQIVSKKHPGYTLSETQKKAAKTKGPYTCDWYRKENPTLCEGCPQKVSSPILLDREVVAATEEERVVVSVEPITKEERTYQIPEFPFPFFRGRVGGIYRKSMNDDEDDDLIYPYDFYVVKRIHDPEEGETLWLRLHLPKDGVREFMIPLSAALSKERFINTIAAQGMAVLGKKQDALMLYVTRWVEELQAMGKSEIARKQFGWLDDNSSFVIGEREILATGEVAYSPPTAATLPIVPMMQSKGDFHIWKDVINAWGRPNMEQRAFAFFMGFGGPLMKFVGEGMLDGFLLNLISQKGGSGKTTLLHGINSIYGRPKELLLSYKDTHNHRLQRLGVMQSLTPTIDEMTNMEPKGMSNLVYDITSGKGKNRMSSKANVERINNVSWSIPVVTTSNRRIKDALLTIKSFPEAELLRILEDYILPDPHDDPTWSKAHFGRLSNNYGHAIDPYIKYIVMNLPTVIELLNRVNRKLDRAANIVNTERFWSAGIAIAITGGIISKNLGLHDIAIEPVFDHAVKLVKDTRAQNKEEFEHINDYLGGFLQQHYHDILVINDEADKRTGITVAPLREPKGKVVVRYEPDTKRIFIDVRDWRAAVAKDFIDFDGSLQPYKKNGSFVGIKRKRMLKGTIASDASPVNALEFNTDKLNVFSEEVILDKSIRRDDDSPLVNV
jgi:hypothetical protein